MKILFAIIFLSPFLFKCIIFIKKLRKKKKRALNKQKKKEKKQGEKSKQRQQNKIRTERTVKEQTNKEKKNQREERYLFNVITKGQRSNWNGGSKISRVFSPNWRESILVGQGRKYLSPSPTKISLIFHPNQTTPKTLFSPPFSILPIFTPTKWTPKVC